MQIVENPCDRNWKTPEELELEMASADDDFELDCEMSEIGGCGPAGCRDGRGPDGVWRPEVEVPCCEAGLWVNYDPDGWERKLLSFRPMPPIIVQEIPQPEVQSQHDHTFGLVRRPMPRIGIPVSRTNRPTGSTAPTKTPKLKAEAPKVPTKKADAEMPKHSPTDDEKKRRPRCRNLTFQKEQHPKHGWRYSCLKGRRLYVADIKENITPGVPVRCEEVRTRRTRKLFIVQVRVV